MVNPRWDAAKATAVVPTGAGLEPEGPPLVYMARPRSIRIARVLRTPGALPKCIIRDGWAGLIRVFDLLRSAS